MFTGLVEKVSIVKDFLLQREGARITFEFNNDDIKKGDSISVNGVCLTVTSIEKGLITADVMNQTLTYSNLKFLKKGSKVNLERAMGVNSRFDGSIVTGHIDRTAKVKSIKQDGFSKRIEIEADTDLIIEKGSIVVNGVSLTVSNLFRDSFEVSLIPTTLSETNLSDLKTGDIVNIEYDVIGKYIQKFINKKQKFKITEEFLKEHGF